MNTKGKTCRAVSQKVKDISKFQYNSLQKGALSSFFQIMKSALNNDLYNENKQIVGTMNFTFEYRDENELNSNQASKYVEGFIEYEIEPILST